MVTIVMHHDNFVSHTSKLNGVSYIEFIALIGFEIMIFVFLHVPHY